MRLDVLLELGEEFRFGVLVADLYIFGTVIANDAAPERVVHVERKSLLVLSVDRLDYVR